MLEPEYLAEITLELEKSYYDLETEILKDIARRIKKNNYSISSSSEYQKNILMALGQDQQEISKKIAKLLSLSQEEADKILSDSSYLSVENDNAVFKEAFESGIISSFSYDRGTLKDIINDGIKALNNELGNICGTTALQSQKLFINASNSAYLAVQSGAFSYDRAIENEIKKLAKKGLGIIEYRSGARRKLDGAIRNAVRTAINQTACKCQDKNFEALGGNLVIVTSHMGARPEHALWQGGIYWRKEEVEGYANFEETTKYGSGEGLGGWNCRHSWFPYFPGISSNPFERYNLKENEERYDLTQEQRYNERMIREWDRRNQIMKSSGIDNSKEAAKLKEWRDRQSAFMKAHSELARQYSKERGYSIPVLLESEKSAVYSYVGGESYLINDALRRGLSLSPGQEEIVKNLDKALDKLPTYRGEVSRSLWFHTNDDVNDFVKQHCINSEITYSAFTSSTAGSVYNKEAQVQLCWYSNKGKDMIKYNPEEKEVLYPRNSKFKVVDITKDGNVYNITLEEI